MKVELFPFQKTALDDLHNKVYDANESFKRTGYQQIISFTAPTGSGKTIVMSSLIENIFWGTSEIPLQKNAIILWLSDSPELNLQSKEKIDLKCDKLSLSQTQIIEDTTFDQEILEDGHIYFINTQKLSKSSNLTKKGDKRSFSIWETFNNTIEQKPGQIYLIIDEAHRGAIESNDEMTIMQKFIKGRIEENILPFPLVIGMSATVERFNKLIEGTNSTVYKTLISTDDVKTSGLLKDRIIINHPDQKSLSDKTTVLLAAADEWIEKTNHWHQYCSEQHYAHVYPIFLIQVENGGTGKVSNTNLNDCLKLVEERINLKFKENEVVHSFGDIGDININGLLVRYVKPSEIVDDRKIKLVFFKESLTTGWDCPRAEVMVSFRKAHDATYISQLLGRMVRTPMQSRIQVDETLNDVHLFLPFFDNHTVEELILDFQKTEGNTAVSDIETDEIQESKFENLSVRYSNTSTNIITTDNITNTIDIYNDDKSSSLNLFNDELNDNMNGNSSDLYSTSKFNGTELNNEKVDDYNDHSDKNLEVHKNELTENSFNPIDPIEFDSVKNIDRFEIMKMINDSGLLSYSIRDYKNNDYFISLFKLARLISQSGLAISLPDELIDEIIIIIEEYIARLKEKKLYNKSIKELREYKMATQVFDVFGKSITSIKNEALNFYVSSDIEIEINFRRSEQRLHNEGVGMAYGERHYDGKDPNTYKLDVILFTSDKNQMENLENWAKSKFYEVNDKYRRDFAKTKDEINKRYNDIVKYGFEIMKSNFRLPENIIVRQDKDGEYFNDHLFVNEQTGKARLKLNGWEIDVLNEERSRDDFITWIRNTSRANWSLTIPYEINGDIKPAYPDFIIVRKDGQDIVVDILEPHNPDYEDNLPKAKGFAKYARENPGLGRIELIREIRVAKGIKVFKRIDLSQGMIAEEVMEARTNEELNHIFKLYGYSY